MLELEYNMLMYSLSNIVVKNKNLNIIYKPTSDYIIEDGLLHRIKDVSIPVRDLLGNYLFNPLII